MSCMDLSVIFIVAIFIEVVNLILRFGFGLTSQNSHKKIMKHLGFKRFLHVHHLYTGLIMAIVAYYFGYSLIGDIGVGVALSDLIHHILLKIINNDSEFSIMYKNGK